MPLIVWDETMSVHVDVFDREHQGMLSCINQIYEAAVNGKGKDLLPSLLEELVSLTRTHFDHEERVMQDIAYPETTAHKKEHDELYDQILDIQAKHKLEGGKIFSLEMMIFLKNWFLSHVLDADRKLTCYLLKRGFLDV